MDDVIENCATTFEEDGVNQQTLDDIRKVGIPSFVQHVQIIASLFYSLSGMRSRRSLHLVTYQAFSCCLWLLCTAFE